MALVCSGGGAEKVKIDGIPVKKKMNLKTKEAFNIIATAPGNITQAFKFKNKIYICTNNKIYEYNPLNSVFTFIVDAPDKYIFTNDESIFCGCYKYVQQSNYRDHSLSIHKYNFESNSFTKVQERGASPDYSEKPTYEQLDTPLCFGYDTFYSIRSISGTNSSAKNIDIKVGNSKFMNSLKFNQSVNSVNFGTKKRCVNLEKTNHMTTLEKYWWGAPPNPFSMYVNGKRVEYVSSADFNDTYRNGSLAVIDNKVWFYGTNSSGVTKRIEWTGTTYENEEIISTSPDFNLNDTIPLQLDSGDVIFAGKGNKIFKIESLYKEV